MNELKSKIESILFLQGEPMEAVKIAKIVGVKPREVEKALEELRADWRERGIILISHTEEWQFATHPKNKAVAEKFFASEFSSELGKSALEILARRRNQ